MTRYFHGAGNHHPEVRSWKLEVGSGAQGLRGSRVQGFRGSGVQGFMGSGVQEFMGSWVHGFRGSRAAAWLSNAAAQRSRISLRSIFNPGYADFKG
jgi:hypothetical protein